MSWGNPETPKEKVLSAALKPAAAVYGTGAFLRLKAYGMGYLKQQRLPADVISVGNITCGGTGKTPVTIDLAQRLIVEGRRVAILSRGYKRKSSAASCLVVSDGRGRLLSAGESGDEPYLMATRVPEAVVVVGSKRADAGWLAINRFQCDTLLLDDGFQHINLYRNTDIVLLDYFDDLDKDALLPAGRLREPASALARAQWIVITKVPRLPDMARLEALYAKVEAINPKAKFTACRFVPQHLRSPSSDVSLPANSLSGKKIVAFAGIARTERFIAELESLGAQIVSQRFFPDHHWYGPRDIRELQELYASSNADLLVTTEKDQVKLSELLVGELPICALSIKTEWLKDCPVATACVVP